MEEEIFMRSLLLQMIEMFPLCEIIMTIRQEEITNLKIMEKIMNRIVDIGMMTMTGMVYKSIVINQENF